jgi:hypothetical protein
MRKSQDYAGSIFLILEGFAAPISDAVEEQCLFYGVMLTIIPPHTSDQLQLLDLGLFAVQKLECHHVHPDIDLNTQTVKILKMPCSFQKALTPLNIIKVFRWAGLVSRWDGATKTFICHSDRDCRKDVRCSNQAKSRVSGMLESRWEGGNQNRDIKDIVE